ncbi:MAG: hypothetical protein V3U11_06015 [Planctomycetota bacterium]
MFEDSFLINLVIFVAGQAAAYGYLRTGRRNRGVMLMILAWVLIDFAMVRAFAFGKRDTIFLVALTLMQVYSLVEVFLFTMGRVRRRTSKVRQQRQERFESAFLHHIRNDLDAAIADYRVLVRLDPWDLESTLGLATALARKGKGRQARRYFRSARSLDLRHEYGDVIGDELKRFSVRHKKSAT